MLRHGHEPGRGPCPPPVRDDPHLPDTDGSRHKEECASSSFTREEDANSYDDNDSEYNEQP